MATPISSSEPTTPGTLPEPARSHGGSPWRSRRAKVAVIAVVAAVVLAGVLWEVHLQTLSHAPSSPSTQGPIPYSEARTIATESAGPSSASSWNVLAAGAVLLPSPIPLPLSMLSQNLSASIQSLGCQLSLPDANATLLLSASNVSADLGISPAWFFALDNGTGAILLVTVLDGTGTIVASLSGGTCGTLVSFTTPVSPSAVDSPKVAVAAGAAGGDTFLAAHPGATVTMAVNGGAPLLAVTSVWNVSYLACPSIGPAASGTGAVFSVEVSPSTGKVLGTSNGTLNCSLSIPSLPSIPSIPLSSSLGNGTLVASPLARVAPVERTA